MLRALLALILLSSPALATTYHLRLDGGDQSQCTGRASVAYSPRLARTSQGFRGRAAECAFNHPFWLLNQGSWSWLTKQSDVIQFDDDGPYYMGQGPFKGL